jgi:hypothetical protein
VIDHIELTIDDLLLDEDNPRIGAVSSQSEALEAIVRLNLSHFRNLMLSIKENGLDPGDSLYVIESEVDGDFIVLEGNRRLSAMAVLNNPNILDGTELPAVTKKSLLRASSGFNRENVEPIRCVLFETRNEANEWIYRRHTGQANGEGRITWGPLEIQRFEGDRSVLDVIDFVGRNASYSDEEWEATKSMIESRKSSNLARLLESAYGKKFLGISINRSRDEKTPLLTRDPKWALKVLQKIIEDVRDGVIDSRDMNKASDIEDYFKRLPKQFQPSSGKKPAPRAFKEINLAEKTAGDKVSQKKSKSATKTSRAPRPRKSLAPKKHSFKVPESTKGQLLLREASLLDADKFKISAAFVLRAFVELAVNEYMETHKLPKRETNTKGVVSELDLAQKADRVIKDIVSNDSSKNADLRGFRNIIINKSSPSSIQSLSGFVHNKYQIPTPDSLRSGWDSSVPLFIAAFGTV